MEKVLGEVNNSVEPEILVGESKSGIDGKRAERFDFLFSRFSLSSKQSLFWGYTCVFVVTTLVVFQAFWRHGLSFLSFEDAWQQHSKALAYYGIWLRDLLSSWVHGNFTFPTFSLSFGYGADLLTTLQYYVIGDPLNLLAVFVPVEHTEILYSILIIIRLYLAGLIFAFAMRYISKTGNLGIIVATISYVFSSWAVYSSGRHSFFLLPLICFPFVVWGVEKVIRERRISLLTTAVLVSAIVNFYFFYMIVLLTILYVIVRLVAVGLEQGWEVSAHRFGQICLSAITGVGLAAFALIPVLLSFFHSSRSHQMIDLSLWYEQTDYYHRLFLSPVTIYPLPGNWALVYTGPLTLLVIFWVFRRLHGYWQEKVFIIMSVVFLLLPWFGHVFNGMSYPTNRWSWAVSFLVSYLICIFWNEIWQASVHDIAVWLLLFIVYVVAAIAISDKKQFFSFEVMGGLFICVLIVVAVVLGRAVSNVDFFKVFTAFLVIGGVIVSGFWLIDYRPNGEIMRGTWEDEYKNNEALTVSQVAEDVLPRYERSYSQDGDNNSILHGVSSSQFYWSIDSSQMLSVFSDLAINDNISWARTSNDGRSVLGVLYGSRYHIANRDSLVPYGYSPVANYTIRTYDHNTDVVLLENRDALPLSYSYEKALSNDLWSKLSPTQREEAMLYAVKLDENVASIPDTDITSLLDATKLDFTTKAGKGVELKKHSIITTAEKQTVDFDFSQTGAGEIHIFLKGFDAKRAVEGQREIQAEFNCGDTSFKSQPLLYETKAFIWFQNMHDFIINSHYCAAGSNGATLTFDKPGTYTFDEIEVWYQPLKNIDSATEKLRQSTLENLNLHDIGLSRATNEITGEITLDKPKIMVLTIPKTDGWTAYVDGKEQEILTANTMWMGLELEPGHHDIKFVYHTPGLRLGVLISVVTVFVLGVVWIMRHKKTRELHNQSGTDKKEEES